MDKSELIRLKVIAEMADAAIQDDQVWAHYDDRLCAAYVAAANPKTVLALIDDLVKTRDALAHCRDKNSQLEKEADWLAEKASECAKGKCWEECPVSCKDKDAAQEFRKAARKAVD